MCSLDAAGEKLCNFMCNVALSLPISCGIFRSNRLLSLYVSLLLFALCGMLVLFRLFAGCRAYVRTSMSRVVSLKNICIFSCSSLTSPCVCPVLGRMPRRRTSLMRPLAALAAPGTFLFCKLSQLQETAKRRVTERELKQLNHKIVSSRLGEMNRISQPTLEEVWPMKNG